MYQGPDGNQYCMETSAIPNWKFTDETETNYYFHGKSYRLSYSPNHDIDEFPLILGQIYVNSLPSTVGSIIKEQNQAAGDTTIIRACGVHHDTIRLYLATGYLMNSIGGYSVKVKAPVNKVSDADGHIRMLNNNFINLLDWYMPKEYMKNMVKWLDSPIYFTNAYYDRYIEIPFISPYDLSIKDGRNRKVDYVYEDDEYGVMRGTVNEYANFIIEFATVSPESVTPITSNPPIESESYATLDAIRSIPVKGESNSKFFNVRIEEDENTHSILYYPVYGEGQMVQDLSLSVMAGIETGTIPMIDLANYDMANYGMDEFLEAYGTDADKIFKWIIINELSITYNYKPIISSISSTDLPVTEFYTNTIDYTGKTDSNGQFWRNRFVPYIKKQPGYYCDNIAVQYTCHLYNRMNNIDIIKVASMLIDKPYNYQLTKINTDFINKYKIVNKINKMPATQVVSGTDQQTRYIRSYYDITSIVVKDSSGEIYENGKLTLKLKHTNGNYMFKLFSINQDNVRVPYDLSGPYTYKLVFPSVNAGAIEVSPNMDSENYNLNVGSLIFYISGDVARQIMQVPVSERYFAITTHIPEKPKEETTLYEGTVTWL